MGTCILGRPRNSLSTVTAANLILHYTGFPTHEFVCFPFWVYRSSLSAVSQAPTAPARFQVPPSSASTPSAHLTGTCALLRASAEPEERSANPGLLWASQRSFANTKGQAERQKLLTHFTSPWPSRRVVLLVLCVAFLWGAVSYNRYALRYTLPASQVKTALNISSGQRIWEMKNSNTHLNGRHMNKAEARQ